MSAQKSGRKTFNKNLTFNLDLHLSAVLVEATPERSAQILPSVSDSVVVIAEGFQSEDGTSSECGPLWEAGSVLHEHADFAGGGGGLPPW